MNQPDLPDVVFMYYKSEWDKGARQPVRVYPDGAAFTMDDSKLTKLVRQWFVESDGLTSVERELRDAIASSDRFCKEYEAAAAQSGDHWNKWKAIERECIEQARLNGMGSEREAALLARLETIERELAEAKARIERALSKLSGWLFTDGAIENDDIRSVISDLETSNLQPKGTA